MSLKDRPRLGRGLKGLISATPAGGPVPTAGSNGSPVAGEGSGLQEVPLELIDPNPQQPRETMDPTSLAELVASIKVSGVLQPVLLRPMPTGRYQLVAGHRRTEACRQIGLKTIPAVVRADATDELQAEWALIENLRREDLNPIERARAYRSYLERFNLTHAQGAERLGEDRSVISNFLRLLELTPGIQELIARGLLSAGHAKILAGLEPARQDALANRAVGEGLSVRRLEELSLETGPSAAPTETSVAGHTRTLTAKSPHVVELEEQLSRKLGTKLRIFPSKRKNTGKIVIQYFSLDEFDRIVERFN